MTQRNPSVAIIGAGMSGLCIAILLLQRGFRDVVIYEKATEVGGTWRENNYPGLTCDVPSRLYQYSFAKNPDWTRVFSPGREIQAYFCDIVDRFALRDRIQFGTEVVSATFDGGGWELRTNTGTESKVDFLISATGVLHHPQMPSIDGLDDFGGAVFHSARWDHQLEIEGSRVAVIGTGSTGVQLLCSLAGVAGRVMLFQRTAQWMVPQPNPRYSKLIHAAYRFAPWLHWFGYKAYRLIYDVGSVAMTKPGLRRWLIGAICRAHLLTVRDPALRQALRPPDQPLCKRLVFSPGFYRAMQRDDVELVTAGIDHVEPEGLVTDDGVLHEANIIVLATGFDFQAYFLPMRLTGRDGVTVDDLWSDGPQAYVTVAMPGFPNFFMMLGPHSPVGNYSLTTVAEWQAEHIVQWIERWRNREFDTVEPTSSATGRYNAMLRAAMPRTVWATGCNSWYLGKNGLPGSWPLTTHEHRAMLANPILEHYRLQRNFEGDPCIRQLVDD